MVAIPSKHASRCTLVPAVTGPRLQAGDILAIGVMPRECRVERLVKGGRSCVVSVAAMPGNRPFTVTTEYALRHRRRAPRLPQTGAMLALLRRGEAPRPCVIRSAAAEGHIDAVDRQGHNALLLAATHGLCATTAALLAHGSRADFAEPVHGETAMIRAARHGHHLVVDVLLEAVCDMDHQSFTGMSALMEASAEGHTLCVARLLHHGADVALRETSTGSRHDALRLALSAHERKPQASSHILSVKMLAGYGSNAAALAAPGGIGTVKGASTEVAAWLQRSRAWGTPLHHIDGMSPARARQLLREGADVHARLNAGAPSPLEVAEKALTAQQVVAQDTSPPDARIPQLGVNGRPSAARANSQAAEDGGGVLSRCGAATGLAERSEPTVAQCGGGVDTAVEAASEVVRASRGWSPLNATLFPREVRTQAAELAKFGWRLSRQHGGASHAFALWDLWVWLVMPLCLTREPWLARPDDAPEIRLHLANAARAGGDCRRESCPCAEASCHEHVLDRWDDDIAELS